MWKMGFYKWGLIKGWRPNSECDPDSDKDHLSTPPAWRSPSYCGLRQKRKGWGRTRTLCPQILSQQPNIASAAPEVLWKPVFIRMTGFRGCLSPTDSILVEHPLKRRFHTLPPENWARSKAGQAKAALPTALILWPWAAQAPAVLSHLFTEQSHQHQAQQGH